MTNERVYEIISNQGIGYTEDEFYEALSVVKKSLDIKNEVSYDGSDLIVKTGSGIIEEITLAKEI